MNKERIIQFNRGVKDGLPIGLGYLSVSFAFGVKASLLDVPILIALLISATNLTSAGQLAGLEIIGRNGALIEIVLTQLIINARYFLMSITLSQKLSENYPLGHRLLTSYGITDEIFAVSITKNRKVDYVYFYGLMLLPYICWCGGTLFGAILGSVLPMVVQNALGIALYAMFIAIIIPPSREDKAVLSLVLLSAVFSCCFYFIPLLKTNVSQGFAVIICALLSSAIMAFIKPIKKGVEENEQLENGSLRFSNVFDNLFNQSYSNGVFSQKNKIGLPSKLVLLSSLRRFIKYDFPIYFLFNPKFHFRFGWNGSCVNRFNFQTLLNCGCPSFLRIRFIN